MDKVNGTPSNPTDVNLNGNNQNGDNQNGENKDKIDLNNQNGENKNSIPYERFKEINEKSKILEEKLKVFELEKQKIEEEKLKKEGNFEEILRKKDEDYQKNLTELNNKLIEIEKDKLFLKYNLDKNEFGELIEGFTDLTKIDNILGKIGSKLKLENTKKLDNQNGNGGDNQNGNDTHIFTKKEIGEMSIEDYRKNKEIIDSQYTKGLIK